MSNRNYSRTKNFYIIFNRDSPHKNQYCKVEASVQQDVELYADHYFQDEWLRVLSSGQWWEYKRNNRHLVPINPEKVVTT
jgi:hypothetical protein